MNKSETKSDQPKLKRVLTLPLLIFYGLGVTIGAGIFALIGEVVKVADDRAPLSFLIAALIAGATGLSYAVLVRVFPRAGGEAVFVGRGIGRWAGRLAGIGVVITAIISSAVIALAFAGYASQVIPLPKTLLMISVIALLAFVAWWGVRESVYFATAVTLLELGTLLLIALFGLPQYVSFSSTIAAFDFTAPVGMAPILAGSILAFFAFIGYEDIENMAEETRNPEYTAPRAILWTLGITLVVYLAISLVAVSIPDRAALAGSPAPMAKLFESTTGLPGSPISLIAAIAMINGILIQIMMAARVLYGMAKEQQLPAIFATIDAKRQTPVFATFFVTAIILLLALTFPLVQLAAWTSIVTIIVFAMVNLSLFLLSFTLDDYWVVKMRWWGLFAAALCIAILAWQLTHSVQVSAH